MSHPSTACQTCRMPVRPSPSVRDGKPTPSCSRKRNYDRISDINCYRGDYLAFREISLSYSLPQSWIHKSGLSKVDVSVTAQNLGYITAAKNMATPEYGVSQNGGYPLPRTVVLGLNVTF